MSNRLPHGAAKTLILDAAEVLFAEVGVEAASFRDITARAGVSLSAINYHFGTKQAVLTEVFARHSRRLTDQRMTLLHQIRRDATGRPILNSVLDAFLRPSFIPLDGQSNALFNRLRARLVVEKDDTVRRILGNAFDKSDQSFIVALLQALPNISEATIYWRFHLMIGAMVYTMADPGQLEGLSGGTCRSSESPEALRQMIDAFAAAFCAPEL